MHQRDEARPDRKRTRALFARFIRARRRSSDRPETPIAEYEHFRDELVVVHLNLVRFLAVRSRTEASRSTIWYKSARSVC
jgi:hypothetical protein